ncbi:MAG: peptidoglycan-binding protein [Candidatus Paceibacterota bacterium]|jgi:peptidoglycan hydrolase-like protein with peptidoglycan-binding domain|nr:peptidoglycan-binding protein [Candidatus Paceibacterota bacterium]MDD4999122.1 peptidoglycan-binding protein [Candidatus Paceibacterota bacterium]
MSKKLIALALAGLFILSVVAPAKAVTVDELQAQITALLAQITTLQQQLAQAQGQTSSGVCFYTDLQQGMTSAEVSKLQTQLKLDPTVYPEGLVTGYFGPLTLKAAKAFQAKYGIITTGYVGPLTRAKLNELYCTPTTTTTVAPTETTTTTTPVAAAEGILTVTQYAIPASGTVTVYGGNTNKEVAAYKLKASNSDIRVKRVLVQLGILNDFPWRDLSSISIWDGSTLLKEVAVNSTNLTETTWATTYQLTFDGLDFLVAKDAEKIISLKVSALAVPQYKGAITTLIPANGIRGVDTANLNVYGPATNLTAYSFTTATADVPSVTLSVATDNPPEGNVIVSKTATTRVDLLKFNVKVENIDATFKSGTITVNTNSNSAMSAVELYDGTTLLASAATTTTGDLAWSTFTLPVSAGTTKTLTVKGVVAASSTIAGETLKVTGKANAALSGVDANGAALSLTHSAIAGNTMTVYTVAPTFTLASATSVRSNSSTTTINDVGDFAIGIKVTANGGDIYLPTASHGTYGNTVASSSVGFYPTISTGLGTLKASSSSWTCDSSAIEDTANKEWRIPAGVSSVCTLTVNAQNQTADGYYNVSTYRIIWDTVTGFGTKVLQTTGLSALKAPELLLKH